MRFAFLLPNLITTLNLYCGFYSIIQTMHFRVLPACWAIVIAGFCDMMDGQVARMTQTTSAFGVQYDSFSDLVSFGLAPALLMQHCFFAGFGFLGMCMSFVFVVAGALRLARFNIKSIQPEILQYYEGLPITIAGGMIATYGIFSMRYPYGSSLLCSIIAISLAIVMVSNIRFVSMKQMTVTKYGKACTMLVLSMILLLMFFFPEGVFLVFLTYWLASMLCHVLCLFKIL